MSMAKKRSPGPWRYREGNDSYTHIVEDRNKMIVCQLRQDHTGIAELDARLIAAACDLDKNARDLLAVLQRFGDWDDGCFYYNGRSAPELQSPMQALADAIAKAEGK